MHSSYRSLLLAVLLLSPLASRAETSATCTGFIESVPTVINTQGTWCLRHDLSTAIASGNAIEVATNNVTIDCNGYKLGGLAAGPASYAYGIRSDSRTNITVRNCSVRGFFTGISVQGGEGHLIEDNRLDNNLFKGAEISGESIVRRNRIFDTGGHPIYHDPTALSASGDIIDNVVSNVFSSTTASVRGIEAFGPVMVRGNRVSGLVNTGAATIGIIGFTQGVRIEGNHVSAGNFQIQGQGIFGPSVGGFCLNNTVHNLLTPYTSCGQSVGNLSQ
jgi:hypothetical protein